MKESRFVGEGNTKKEKNLKSRGINQKDLE
jgi:hypothetical protein